MQAQYAFVHDALCEVIKCGDTEISATRLREIIDSLSQPLSGDTTITGFQQQFEVTKHIILCNFASVRDLIQLGKTYSYSRLKVIPHQAPFYCGYLRIINDYLLWILFLYHSCWIKSVASHQNMTSPLHVNILQRTAIESTFLVSVPHTIV